MFYIVKEGGSCPYGIAYLVDRSKFHGRFEFFIKSPWLGNRVALIDISIPNPFRKSPVGWAYPVIVGVCLMSKTDPTYESSTKG